MQFRVGFGYDTHKLVSDRPLYLGGVKLNFDKGLLGHSDADVLIHAICDALLGAAGKRDIGYYFPDNQASYKDMHGKTILKSCFDIIARDGWSVENIDSTLCLEQPKLTSHIDQMKENIAEILEIEKDRIGIKATTNEKMGFVGKEEGIVAYAVALVKKEDIS